MTETGGAGARVSTGRVHTFLIADVRGYTRYTVEHGDEAAAQLAAYFALIVREIVSAQQGAVIELRGDEALAVFASPRQALRAAVALQERCAGEVVASTGPALKVGIGLDAGEAVPVEGGYRGGALNLAARLCSLAGPGEVLASEVVTHLARKMDDLRYGDRGAVQLKGFAEPVRVMQVLVEAAEASAPGEKGAETMRERPLPIGGFLGALPAGPLVARDEELRDVLSAVDPAGGGSGRLIFLVGEPGVGKTRLAQEVTVELHNREFLVASGRCYEPQEAVPYYPFLEALGTLVAAAPSSIRDVMPQRWPYMARLLPGVSLSVPPNSSEGREEQERLFWSVTGFLQTVAEQVPVALLLDDLHWADGASLALLQHLARHTRAYRVLLLGTYRDVEVGRQHPLQRALRDLHREGLAERILIRRLGQEGTAALIATTLGQQEVSEGFSSLVHRHTEGNPFFTHEVLRTLVERGDIYQEDGRWEGREIEQIEVPESVRSTIGERLSRLGEDTQEVLQVASVLGQIFHFDALAAMTDRSEEEAEAALEEAVTGGLVRETTRDHYGFNHALTQQALYADLSSRKRRRLHLAAGEALERAGPSEGKAPELAWHFLEGDDPERAMRYALQAGDEAEEVYAHQEAERQFRTVLTLARETGDQASEAEAVEKLGGVMLFQGRSDEALEMLEYAVDLYRLVKDREGEGRTEAKMGMAHFSRGTSQKGIVRLQPRLLSLEHHVSLPVLCALYEAESQLFFGTNQYQEHLESAERWVQTAQETGNQGILARARGRHGTALAMRGRVEEGIAAHREAIDLAETAGEMYGLMFALNDLAETYQMRGEFDKAMALRERYLQTTEQMEYQDEVCFALCGLAQTLLLLGKWQQAQEHVDKAATLIRSQTSWYAMVPPLVLGELYLLQGDYDEAQHYAAEALRIAERNQDLQGILGGRFTQAQLDLGHGHPEAAIACLEPLLDRPDLEGAQLVELLPVLAEIRLALAHDPEGLRQAEVAMHEALERAAAQGNRVQLVHALRVEGMLLARQSHWDRAERAFEEAISLARSMPYPYAEAHALYEWGRMLGAKGEVVLTRRRLADALEIFRRLGARAYIDRIEQTLAVPR